MKYLLEGGKHKITALTRANGGSKIPEGVAVAEIDYDEPSTLVSALRGQEFLIISLSVTAPRDTQSKIITAAAEAGVPYIMPNEYGPDSANEPMILDMLVGEPVVAARKQIQELGVSKWVGLSCGFWYEWSLPLGKDFFGFDLKNREVILFDDGKVKIDTSTWPQCGRVVAGLLSFKILPDDENDSSLYLESYANGIAYVTSFTVSQRDMLESAMRVTGTKESDWKISHENAKERWEKARAAFFSSGGSDRSAFGRTMYTRIFFPAEEGYLEKAGRKTLNGPLNLPKEDLDEWTKWCVDFAEAGKSWFAQ